MESELQLRSYMDPVTENAVAGLQAGLCWAILEKCLTRTKQNSPFYTYAHQGSHNNCPYHARSGVPCSCAWVREMLQRFGWADRARADPPLFSAEYSTNSSREKRERSKTFSLQLPSELQNSNAEIMFLVSITLPWPLSPLASRSSSQGSDFLDQLRKHTLEGVSAYKYVYVHSPPPRSTSFSISIPSPDHNVESYINRDGDGDIMMQRDGDGDIMMPQGNDEDDVVPIEQQEEDNDNDPVEQQQEDNHNNPAEQQEDNNNELAGQQDEHNDDESAEEEEEDDDNNDDVDEEVENDNDIRPPSPSAREQRPPLSPIDDDDEDVDVDASTDYSNPFKHRRFD